MESKNNILKSMSSYNSTNMEAAILTLKKELEQQKNINETLKDKDLKKKQKKLQILLLEMKEKLMIKFKD